MTLSRTLIIFDCDGTLVDSQHLIAEAMRLAFVDADLISPDRTSIIRTVGLSLPEAIAYLAPEQHSEMREELVRSYRQWYLTLRHQPQMQEPMFQGAASLLFDLAARDGVTVGVATGKSLRGVMRMIDNNNLNGIFSTIQTADNAPSKPNPAMLLQAMEETGASPETTIMIGDTSYDMIMAACANVDCIGVAWGYHTMAELKKAGAQMIVRSFGALRQALETKLALPARYEAVA